jgi:lysophospholipase L1-like esterase
VGASGKGGAAGTGGAGGTGGAAGTAATAGSSGAGGGVGSGGTSGMASCTATAACRVMPLGDSITDGFNVPGGYRNKLWDLIQQSGKSVDFVGSVRTGPNSLPDRDHEGHPIWLTRQIAEIVVQRLNTYRPDIVLLHIGTNDAEVVPDQENPPMFDQLSDLVDQIAQTAPNSVLIVAQIVGSGVGPEVQQRIVESNSKIPAMVQAKAATGYSIYYVDMFSAVPLSDIDDEVHPNEDGYDKMADAWWTVLQRLLP